MCQALPTVFLFGVFLVTFLSNQPKTVFVYLHKIVVVSGGVYLFSLPSAGTSNSCPLDPPTGHHKLIYVVMSPASRMC
ncbi:hypothetical protein MTP99_004675 [Tenebrio molitor]|nr:hypothetical protein MTP99_004675 [Tenebrio molitor]